MQKDFYLSRYSLIIKKLEAHPTNYNDLEDYLLNSFEFQDAGATSYSIRTLQRDIREISRLFGITIHNKKKGDNRYYIESRPEMEADEYNQKLLESFQISNALSQHPDFADFVFFESRKPTGLEHFYNLFFAIRHRRIINFRHHKYKTDSYSKREVHPLALKESEGRWYLVAVDTGDAQVKSFGLDRIDRLEISKSIFKNKYKFNARKHFRHAFGVMNIADKTPERIHLRCSKEQGRYIASYPIHHSQNIIEENQEFIDFEFLLYPTYDFIQEVLSYGREATILSPQTLISEIRNHLADTLYKYERVAV